MRRYLSALVALVLVSGTAHAATIYTGSLSSADGGITGAASYASGVTLEWTVTQDTAGGPWTYEYVITLDAAIKNKKVSHFIIEVSPAFTADDIVEANYPSQNAPAIQVGPFDQNNGNPGLPALFRGLKFDETEPDADNDARYTFTLVTFRGPTWGDIYAKDGKTGGDDNIFYNTGFTAADPVAPLTNGTNGFHVIVPDTVPEPATAALLLTGAALLRRRR